MNILLDFMPYTDGYGLMAPNPVPNGVMSGSDNGPMFSSEVIIMYKRNGADIQYIVSLFSKIESCISKEGLLNRVPQPFSSSQEGPDDYLGVLNACIEIGVTSVPRRFLLATLRYLGFLNNVNPGKFTSQSFLIRQPQLLCCMINAAFPNRSNFIHVFIRLLAFPLYLYSAVAIAISCRNDPTTDSNSRRLGWHLQNNLKKTSLLCWLASKVFGSRLYKDYPNFSHSGFTTPESLIMTAGGMREVADIYYYPQGHLSNPYSKYWVY